MKMVDRDIQEWLSKYKRLTDNEAQEFAVSSTGNDRLINALFNLFEILPADVQHIDPVCRQLFDLYRSKERRLQVFALQFVPALIWLYLTSLSKDNREVCGSVETFLLGVYNLEIVQADGTQVVETFRIPALGRPSVYHDPRGSGLQSEALTESALRILNRAHDVWKGGPHPQYESFNTQNRFCILTVVMQHYNRLVDAFHSTSLEVLCRATDGLVSSGFGNVKQPRIPVHPSLLVEMLAGIYFALYNGHQPEAVQAIKATHVRACYELYSDVLLMTNGLLNSFKHGELPKKSCDKEGLLTPSGSKKGLAKGKQSITNASFKAKKLPDDIEFTEEEESSRLSTVEEDGEHSMAKNLKAKLMNIGGKLGGGDKNRNRDSRRESDVGSVISDGSDSVGVAVVKGGGHSSSKTVVDVVEMQPIRGSGTRRSDSREPGIDQLEDDLEKMGEIGGGGAQQHRGKDLAGGKASGTSSKSASTSSSSLVFSKKLGFSKSASASPTTGTHHSKEGPHGQHSSHAESRKSIDASVSVKHSAPSLPAIISETSLSPAPSASTTNGMTSNNSNNNSSSNSSSGIFNRSGSGRASNHSNSDKRASSEGRSSIVETTSGSLSIHKTDKTPKIHSSISDSNLPPPVQASTNSSSNNVVPTRPHSKTSATVNRNSFSTDL